MNGTSTFVRFVDRRFATRCLVSSQTRHPFGRALTDSGAGVLQGTPNPGPAGTSTPSTPNTTASTPAASTMAPAPTTHQQWCIMWCMKRTNIYLDEEQTVALDRLAAQEGVSRAELIRQLLDRVLANADENLASDLQAIDDSFGALRDIDVPVRGQRGREDHLGHMWRRSS
jgi:Ribbon-helix-helix protein, copG family